MFVGACIDPNNVYLLWGYCAKGSLRDVLHNTNIKLDWMFKLSFISSISVDFELACLVKWRICHCTVAGQLLAYINHGQSKSLGPWMRCFHWENVVVWLVFWLVLTVRTLGSLSRH